jgi:uncharacterized membrane protein YagU involved in acid resistance
MDQVTTLMYEKLESEETKQREDEIGGESMPSAVVKRVSRAVTGAPPSEETVSKAAPAVHWLYGVIWGALYGLARNRLRGLSIGAGAPFAAGFWLLSDEGLPVLMKIAPPPQAFPVTTHVRGLVGHVAHTATTDAVCRLLTKVAG